MTLVFVGPQPGSPHIAHAGGQLTATQGFADFAAGRQIAIQWVDTAQSNFPVPPASTRISRAARRLKRFVAAIAAPGATGAILFAGAGVSFFERSLMAFVARLFGKPTVLMIRSGHFQTQFRRSALFRLSARLLLTIPGRIGVQGASWARFLREAGVGDDRIVVIPNWLASPATAPRVRQGRTGEPLRLLFAGWLTAPKGVPELIDAARQLAAEGCDFTLTLAGGGTLLAQVHAAAGEPDLLGRLVVTGWLDRPALAAEMGRSDILILPSHAEGFPNVVMEALAEGLPVIATCVGAIPDSVADGCNGLLVGVGDSEAIADAVRFYIAQPAAIARHSRAALATAAARHARDVNCQSLLDALARSSNDFGGAPE